MNKIKLIKPEKLPKNNEFLWRYLNIHKFLNFISQRRIRFVRMDQFEDPLEGIPFETRERFTNAIINPKIKFAKMIIDNNINDSLNPQTNIFGRKDQIRQIQLSHYVSCWFYDNRESMAMWNSYSNPDGVALRISFGNLINNLVPNESDSNIREYFCGKVDYQDFLSQKSGKRLSKIGKESLSKDLSFSHEKEIRFIVISEPNKKGLKLYIESQPLRLEKLDIKIFCHPRMEYWKKKNIRDLLKENKLSCAYSDSDIYLRS